MYFCLFYAENILQTLVAESMTSRKMKSKPHHKSSGAGSADALFCSVMLTRCPAHKSPASRGERVSPSCFHVQNDDRVRIFSDGRWFGQRGI